MIKFPVPEKIKLGWSQGKATVLRLHEKISQGCQVSNCQAVFSKIGIILSQVWARLSVEDKCQRLVLVLKKAIDGAIHGGGIIGQYIKQGWETMVKAIGEQEIFRQPLSFPTIFPKTGKAKIILQFLAINLITLLLTAPVVAIYGPFPNITRTVVGAIMTSRHPQYVTWLLSESQIKAILGDAPDAEQLQQKLLQFSRRNDDTLRLVNISSTRFHGYMLEITDPTRIQAATARDIQEIGDTVSTIVITNNAVAGINAGDFTIPREQELDVCPMG